jgi:hypothetical protein
VLDSSLDNVITYVDASFSNVYTKLDVLDSSLANVITYVDASFSNVYTKAEVDVSFVSKELFDASLNSIQLSNVYTKAEIDVSFVSKELFDASLNGILSDGVFIQNNDYASYDILDITGKIIFTDSSNVQRYIDISLNNVDICGSLNVAGSINAPNIYTKTEIDASFTNVYSKLDVLDSSLANVIIHVDASFLNVYTRGQIDVSFVSKELFDASLSSIQVSNVYTKNEVDVSFVSKELFDASLSSIQVSNVYTKNEVDVSFVSKQLFETSYNVLLSAIGTGGGGGSGTTTTSSSIAKKFYNQDWNLLGTNITKVKDVSGNVPVSIGFTPDGKTIVNVFNRSTFYTLPNGQRQFKPSLAVYDFISNSWTQRGHTISNEFVNVPSWKYDAANPDRDANYIITRGGYNIVPNAINSTGTKIAYTNVYSRYGSTNNSYLGYTATCHIFEYIGTQWIKQVAQNFNIEPGLNIGMYITLGGPNIKLFNFRNDDIRELTIYTLNNGVFTQDIAQISTTTINNALGETSYAFGRTFSNDGTIILLQRYYNYVVFKYNGTTWIQHGLVLQILTWPDVPAGRVSISDDGNTIMTGNFVSTVNGDLNAGMVKVFKYNNASNTWIQIGQDITYEEITLINEANNLVYGSDALCLSGDGSTVLVGTRLRPNIIYNENVNKGTIQAYRYSNVSNYWSKIGRTMTGIERPGQFAIINYNGNVIALDDEGFQETSTSVFNTGRIRVYEIEVDPSFSSLSSGSSSSVDAYSKIEIDASFSNVYSKLDVLDSSLANVYTRGQVDVSFVSKELFDASFTNVYTKNQVYNKTEIDISFVSKQLFDASFTNVYTRGQVDISFVSKELFDASLANVYTKNQVYTKSQIDVSFVSKQLFDASINALAASIGSGGGGGGGSSDLTAVTSNIIPSTTDTYNLGSTSNYWNEAYIHSLKVSNRVYQEINNSNDWNAVNGHYGLAKQSFPALNSITIMENMFWTRRTHVPFAHTNARKWADVCWSPKLRLFVAVNTTNNANATYSGNIGYSNDGINWNYIYANTNWHNRALYSVCWSDELGIFVACGQYSIIMYSTDGINWNASNAINFDSTRNPEGGNIDGNDICWSPQLKLFVIIDSGTKSIDSIAVSSNGVDWTSVGINYSDGWFQINLACICWSPELGLFVALDGYGPGGEKPNACVVTSSDGFNWNIEIITQQYSTWNSICWSPQLGLFAACSTAGYHWMPAPQLMTSKDGFDWTIINRSYNDAPFAGDWSDVIWCAELGLFVVSSNVSAFTGAGPYLVSSNGIDWITRDNWEYLAADGLSMHLQRLCWCPQHGIIVGVGGKGGIWGGGQGGGQIWTTSLKGRPPTFYNVFDSSFNRINENGKWDFSNIAVTTLNVTGTFTNTSDDRLKHNEVTITNGLDVIDRLNPKFYQKTQIMLDASYNGDLSAHSWSYEAGLIAQDLLQINDLSFVVSGGDYYKESYIYKRQTNDPSNTNYDISYTNYDPSGNNYDICYNLITQTYNVNYSSVFVYGLAAIKELHAKVKAQETTILSLQTSMLEQQTTINSLAARLQALEQNNI